LRPLPTTARFDARGRTTALAHHRETGYGRLGRRRLYSGDGQALADPVQAQGAQAPRAVLGAVRRDAHPELGDLLLRGEVNNLSRKASTNRRDRNLSMPSPGSDVGQRFDVSDGASCTRRIPEARQMAKPMLRRHPLTAKLGHLPTESLFTDPSWRVCLLSESRPYSRSRIGRQLGANSCREQMQ